MLGQLIPEVGDVSAHGRPEAQGLEWEFHGLHLSQAWCLRGEVVSGDGGVSTCHLTLSPLPISVS